MEGQQSVAFKQRPALTKGNSIVEKNHQLHLHIIVRDVVLSDAQLFGHVAPIGEAAMKRLMIVSLMTVVPIATGCCRGWPRMRMYRGDVCDTCAAASTTGYQMAPMYDGTILPAPTLPGQSTTTLPGPVN